MAILEVNENQKEMLLDLLKDLNWQLKTGGSYGSRQREQERITDLEDIRDLANQLKAIS